MAVFPVQPSRSHTRPASREACCRAAALGTKAPETRGLRRAFLERLAYLYIPRALWARCGVKGHCPLLEEDADHAAVAFVDDLARESPALFPERPLACASACWQGPPAPARAGSCRRSSCSRSVWGSFWNSSNRYLTSSSLCFSVPTTGETSVSMSTRIRCRTGRVGLQPDAEAAALLDDLRLLQGQLAHGGRDQPVARLPHGCAARPATWSYSLLAADQLLHQPRAGARRPRSSVPHSSPRMRLNSPSCRVREKSARAVAPGIEPPPAAVRSRSRDVREGLLQTTVAVPAFGGALRPRCRTCSMHMTAPASALGSSASSQRGYGKRAPPAAGNCQQHAFLDSLLNILQPHFLDVQQQSRARRSGSSSAARRSRSASALPVRRQFSTITKGLPMRL